MKFFCLFKEVYYSNSMSDAILPNLPKKRGRKPKPKPVNLNITEIEIKPKKRGRKPKNKNLTQNENETVKVYKKRGRRPKNVVNKELINYPNEEPIILHIPIKNNNLKLNIQDEYIKYNSKNNFPIPYDNSLNYNFITNTNITDPKDIGGEPKESGGEPKESGEEPKESGEEPKESGGEPKKSGGEPKEYGGNPRDSDGVPKESGGELIESGGEPKESGGEPRDSDGELENTVSKYKEDYNKIKEMCKYDDVNNDDIIKKFKNLCNIYKSNIVIDRNKIEKIFMEYDMANNNNEWPSSTNIDCLWCCYSFNNFPFGIPIKIADSKIQMFGNFCSPECAGAYIFETIKGIEKWEYYSLLNYLYKDKNKIKLAPPRICLKKFGGKLSITEFRATNNNYDKNFRVLLPPLISVIPLLEEINLYNDLKMNEFTCKVNDIDNLKLKRNKPLPESMNTLENCMNLKCV